MKNVTLLKALLTAREILLQELQKLSKAVDQTIEISEFLSKLNNEKILNYVAHANQFATAVGISAQGNPQNGLEVFIFIHAAAYHYFVSLFIFIAIFSFLLIISSLLVQKGNGALDLLIAEKLNSLSESDLLDCCHSVGDQLFYLWNTFLKFHRFAFYRVSLRFNKMCFSCPNLSRCFFFLFQFF